jgi:hypothetical protein
MCAAVWLPETPEKGRAAMFANVKAVYGEGEAQQASSRSGCKNATTSPARRT